MGTLTLSIPSELKQKMDSFDEVNWSAVARNAFIQKMKDLDLLKQFSENSVATQADVMRISSQVKKNIAQKLKRKKK